MKAIIYKITSPSAKSYIGQTRDTFNNRMKGHRKKRSNCLLLKRAINKYGWENMHKEILIEIADFDKNNEENQDLLDFWEQEMIEVFNSQAPSGYNCDSGGKTGGKRSEELNKKISEGMTRYFDKIERKGIIWHNKYNHFEAKVKIKGKQSYIGTYLTYENAQKAIEEYKKTGEKIPGIKKKIRPVVCFNKYSKEEKHFNNMAEAGRYTNVSKGVVWRHCNNKAFLTEGGWTFNYTT